MIKLDIQMNISLHEAHLKAGRFVSEKMLQAQTEEQAMEIFVTECCDLHDGGIYLREDFYYYDDLIHPVGSYSMVLMK